MFGKTVGAWVCVVLATSTALTTHVGGVSARPRGTYTVHVLTIPEAAFVNAFAVETARHVVVVDAGFSAERDGATLRALADSLGKPIAAVLLTHGHVDHYGGLPGVRRPGVPVITSAGVARQIADFDAINYARFGMTPPPGDRRPTRLLQDGETFVVDGVTFTLHDAGPGESYADVWWRISGDGRETFLVGDLVMYGLHPFMQSGHSEDWMRSLDGLKRRLPADAAIYIGHDVAAAEGAVAPRDITIVDWQIARLTEFRSTVAAITDRSRLLTDDEVSHVVESLAAAAPENLPAFSFLVSTTANVLAAELVLERQREEFERMLQALFSGGRP